MQKRKKTLFTAKHVTAKLSNSHTQTHRVTFKKREVKLVVNNSCYYYITLIWVGGHHLLLNFRQMLAHYIMYASQKIMTFDSRKCFTRIMKDHLRAVAYFYSYLKFSWIFNTTIIFNCSSSDYCMSIILLNSICYIYLIKLCCRNKKRFFHRTILLKVSK